MDTQSIQPNAVTLTAVLRTLGRSGQATTARELAERMERYGMLPEWEIPSGYD
jgi:pentatricopeptide repeat protein